MMGILSSLFSRSHQVTREPREYFTVLEVSAWHGWENLDPIDRAKRFYLLGVEELDVVHAAYKAMIPYHRTGGMRHRAREDFLREFVSLGYEYSGPGKGDQITKAFDLTHDFYFSVMDGASQAIKEFDQRIDEYFPSLEYDSGGCPNPMCKKFNKKVFPKSSQTARLFYPPWHVDCRATVFSSDRKPSKAVAQVDSDPDSYFFNPVHFLSAHGIKNI